MPFPIEDFFLTRSIPNATDAVNQTIFSAPFDCKLVSVRTRHKTASTSGTMDLVTTVDAATVAAGTSLLTTPMSNSGTADTDVDGSLLTTIAGLTIPKGSSLGLKFAGTLTNLVNLDITIRLRQLRKF